MTEIQELRIIEILDEHKSLEAYKILSKEFGISQTILRKYCTQMRAEGKLRNKGCDKWSPKELQKIEDMVVKGHLLSEISSELGRSCDSIRKKVIEIFGDIPVIDIEGENWKRIEDTSYEISDCGRLRRKGQRKLINGTLSIDGYVQVNINKQLRRVHRLVAQAFIPNPEDKELVDHIDGNRTNNHINNLRWVTAEENANNIHRLEQQRLSKEKRETSKKIDNYLNEIFSLGVTKLELIRRIVDYQVSE